MGLYTQKYSAGSCDPRSGLFSPTALIWVEKVVRDAAKMRKAGLCSRLKKSILTLEMGPGSALDEARLSVEFGLSRTPLREVFRHLAGEGYVELHENRGASVSAMTQSSLRDFFLAAPMVYGAVMRLAARNATPEQLGGLSAAQDAFSDAPRRSAGRGPGAGQHQVSRSDRRNSGEHLFAAFV